MLLSARSILLLESPREQFPVKVLVKPIWHGRGNEQLHSEPAQIESKRTLKQKQRGRAVQNKAEEKQHDQNTMITAL